MQFVDFLPAFDQPDPDAMPMFDVEPFSFDMFTDTPKPQPAAIHEPAIPPAKAEVAVHDFQSVSMKPEADMEDVNAEMPKPAAAAPKRKAASKPKSPPKPKGRSGGDKSSQAIKTLRTQAADGDLEAAMKLGWGVERLTQLFNKNKEAKGEMVKPGQPIDDPVLLARIAEKHKYQAEVQKKRQEKLRLAALEGNWEAAKKLKMGKKRMEELFPHMMDVEDAVEDGVEEMNDVRVVAGVEEIKRERTPAEPFDFDKERIMMPHQPTAYAMGGVQYNGPSTPIGGHLQKLFGMARVDSAVQPGHLENYLQSWSASRAPDTIQMQAQFAPPQYPTAAPSVFDPARAFRREFDAAFQQVEVAQANLERAKYELEKLQEAEGQVRPQAAKRKMVQVKAEDDESPAKRKKVQVKNEGDEPKSKSKPKSLLYYKKAKKPRPSNFPTEAIEESMGQMSSFGQMHSMDQMSSFSQMQSMDQMESMMMTPPWI